MKLWSKKPHPTFLDSIDEINNYKKLIANTECSACGQKTLMLDAFGKDSKGVWEAEIHCHNCHFAGIVNTTGFKFKQISSKGKARE